MTRLADFKVPKLIHLVSAIPKNAMGKVQRRDLTALFS
jgi:acyl-coenzyme A synthetase/AMP-(fatty) acid ligase